MHALPETARKVFRIVKAAYRHPGLVIAGTGLEREESAAADALQVFRAQIIELDQRRLVAVRTEDEAVLPFLQSWEEQGQRVLSLTRALPRTEAALLALDVEE